MNPKLVAFLILTFAFILDAFAGSASWALNPISGDWNTAANWTPATVPNGPADLATFGSSDNVGIPLSDNVEVASIAFDSGASGYSITSTSDNHLTISGSGITNNSGITQRFATVRDQPSGYGEIVFKNTAHAGSSTAYTVGKDPSASIGSAQTDMFFEDKSSADHASLAVIASQLLFVDQSTADHATIVGTQGIYPGGEVWFEENATAGDAMITSEGATSADATAGSIHFDQTGTAGNSTIVADGGSGGGLGGFISFLTSSSGGESRLIANGGSNGGGGTISFFHQSTGGTARVAVFDNGSLNITFHDRSSGVTIGSLEGNGAVNLGRNNLAIGLGNQNSQFDGVISDGGTGHGSLTKLGSGIMRLTGANTYGGGTTVERGRLIVDNLTGSGTGTGPVQINGYLLGGSGTIGGPVTVGNNRRKRTALAPSQEASAPTTLTILGPLTLRAETLFRYRIDSETGVGDVVVASGVYIQGAGFFGIDDKGQPLPKGMVITVISNTSPDPIQGQFDNLPEDSNVSFGANSYGVSYHGGDGNDLTLTVLQ